MEILKIGSKGDSVKKVQTKLGITADGIYGANTASAVKAWQSANGLTADGVVGEQTWNNMFKSGIANYVIYNPINIHISDRKSAIKYIVIHFTAGRTSRAGSANATRNVFLKRKASADFVVDDRDIVQINPDLAKKYCWAVGDGNGKYGITNANSVHIEMCSSLVDGTNVSMPNHAGWYFTDAVIENTTKLTKLLMEKLHISADNVVRHYDATRKACPGIVGWNDGQLTDAHTGKVVGTNNSNAWRKFHANLIPNS